MNVRNARCYCNCLSWLFPFLFGAEVTENGQLEVNIFRENDTKKLII